MTEGVDYAVSVRLTSQLAPLGLISALFASRPQSVLLTVVAAAEGTHLCMMNCDRAPMFLTLEHDPHPGTPMRSFFVEYSHVLSLLSHFVRTGPFVSVGCDSVTCEYFV
jgi:hypothetical protein